MGMQGVSSYSSRVFNTMYGEKSQSSTNEKFNIAFEEVELLDDEQTPEPLYENDAIFTDNGVKSALLLGKLELCGTQQEQGEDVVTRKVLTNEEKREWLNGRHEGLMYTGAGGLTYETGGMQSEISAGGDVIYYPTSTHDYYQVSAFYDTNSTEDAPVMYVWKYSVEDPSRNESVLLKIDVNKVDPANASYEEMIALAGYIYRDDEIAASKAADAVTMASLYMEADGLDWQHGMHDFTSYYLPELVRRNKDYPNPANKELAKAAEALLEYIKDYPRSKSSITI